MLDFLFDEDLMEGETIEWESAGTRYQYEVDLDYLSRGRAVIEAFAKFPVPQLAQINGFSTGNPLTVVKLRKNPMSG